jgi:serine/threonine-protein kinase
MTEKFGKYEVVRKIGSGGFGAVYEARDPAIKRTVAIKTCLVSDPEVRARFAQEAELAGSLQHRNLTTIYDFGAEGSVLYLVSEFLPGEDLDKIIDRGGPLPLRQKIEILIGIAYGLAHAHDAGIVHRDVKPANVRILPDGTVKIMDFGVAKALYAERELTRTGMTLGTSAYLAPEQVRGEPVDRRADIFAFGVLAYELLSSKRPFWGSNQAAILDAIAKREPPPLAASEPALPASLIALVERTLRKDPVQRPSSLEPIRKELIGIRDQLLTAEQPFAVPPGSPPGAGSSVAPTASSRRPWIAIAVAALLLLGALLLWLSLSPGR